MTRLASLAVALCAMPALAAERLDDSASPRQRIAASLEWREPMPAARAGDDALNALIARVPGVEVRLDTAAYVGREVRIFLRLPAAARGYHGGRPLGLSWRTRGTLLDGQTESDTRAVVFEGIVTQAQMADVFDFTFTLDARAFEQALSLEFVYEIEPR